MVVCRLKLIGEYKTLKPQADRALYGEDRELTIADLYDGEHNPLGRATEAEQESFALWVQAFHQRAGRAQVPQRA